MPSLSSLEMTSICNLYNRNLSSRVTQVLISPSDHQSSTCRSLVCLAISVPADASDASSVKSAFKQIREKLGEQIDVLLYNAGAYTYGNYLDDRSSKLDFLLPLFSEYLGPEAGTTTTEH